MLGPALLIALRRHWFGPAMPWSDLIPFDTSGRLSAIDELDYRLATQVDARAA